MGGLLCLYLKLSDGGFCAVFTGLVDRFADKGYPVWVTGDAAFGGRRV